MSVVPSSVPPDNDDDASVADVGQYVYSSPLEKKREQLRGRILAALLVLLAAQNGAFIAVVANHRVSVGEGIEMLSIMNGPVVSLLGVIIAWYRPPSY
jgi:hypothetical protein